MSLCATGDSAMFPNLGTKASTTPQPKQVVDALTFHGRAFSRKAAWSTLSFPRCQKWWAPVVDRGDPRRKAVAPDVNTQALGMQPQRSPLKET